MDTPRKFSEKKPQTLPQNAVATAPRAGRLGFLGFAAALGALVFFWVPVAGIALWAVGAVLSLAGTFKAPRGFAVSGLFVSLISASFMVYFLGMSKIAETHHLEKPLEVLETTKKLLAPAETPSAKRSRADGFSRARRDATGNAEPSCGRKRRFRRV